MKKTHLAVECLPNPDEHFQIAAFAARHPQHVKSEGALRWHVQRRHTNGMLEAGVVVKTATGALRIHEPSYFAWWFGVSSKVA